MEPGALIPAADAIPASPWFFRVLLDATFAVHLIFMNLMFGLALLGFARALRDAPGLDRQAGLAPNLTALAVNLGVAPLLFVQTLYGQFFYVSSTLMAVWWFGVVLAVMGAYALAYRQKYAFHAGRGPGVWTWALMCLLLLYTSLAQTHNAVLLVRPDLWRGYFADPSGTLTAWADPTVIPRWLHFVLASVALGGLALAMIGHGRAKRRDPHGEEIRREGLAWFCWATVLQAGVGSWWLMALPRNMIPAFMGADKAATGLLAAGVALTLAAVVFAFRGRLMAAAGAGALTVLVMTALRGVLRSLYLDPLFDPATLPVTPEPSTTAMFLGCVVLSLAVILWASGMPKVDRKGA
ncbi:hypothetical protein NNJEOMEG_02811 [Fundidesulfovibrio magnetotacticus]|uniref:Uncharacterized protein n=1 Tax=Fundidesulfovibrio magnetotacticus TaxID=2730080 RepID=A0A6V8LR48_9BACT|nr:hypothetical protein [Fundidesulfovibrio magnetotacticus]GFK94963.1 hypothetical protein NNJEOMEG_02811 [Fundidesulfovibrio magnetotacticus]